MITMYDEKGEFYLDAKDKAILQKCVYENPYIVEEGVNGFLFDPNNVEEIANAIKKSRYTGYVFYMKFAILYNGKYQRHLNIYAYLKNSEYYVFFAYGDVGNKNNV